MISVVNFIKHKSNIKEHINNLGKIKEDETHLICYVDKSIMDRKYPLVYRLHLDGIPDEEKVAGMDKKVIYEFVGIEFEKPVEINSLWAHIIFKNCVFKDRIKVICADSITFQNNRYINYGDEKEQNDFIVVHRANKLKFMSDNLVNEFDLSKYSKPKLNLSFTANQIEFLDSNINTGSTGDINIDVQNIYFEKTTLSTNELFIHSNCLIMDRCSKLSVKTGIVLDSTSLKIDGTLASPIILSNAIRDNVSKHQLEEEKQKRLLFDNRYKLIKSLRQLKGLCLIEKDKMLKSLSDEIDNTALKETLKKVSK